MIRSHHRSPRLSARFVRGAAVPAVAAVLAATTSACGAVTDNNAAAVVGDGEVSQEEFERLVKGFSAPAVSSITGLSVDEATDTVPGDARSLLAVLVQREAVHQFLDAAGEEITDADRAAFTDTVDTEDPFFELPEDVQRVVIDLQVAPQAVARVGAPDASELQRRYEEDPAGLGVVCMRHILSDSQSEAAAIAAELQAGADFAELAAARSTDPTAVDNGGSIQSSTGEACMAAAEALQLLDPTFVDAAFDARPGTRVGPVQTQFGWHVIESVPYEEASSSLSSLFEQNAGQLLLDGYLRSIDVAVDPRYGVWQAGTQSIEPLI